jgi:hypothetical protein
MTELGCLRQLVNAEIAAMLDTRQHDESIKTRCMGATAIARATYIYGKGLFGLTHGKAWSRGICRFLGLHLK